MAKSSIHIIPVKATSDNYIKQTINIIESERNQLKETKEELAKIQKTMDIANKFLTIMSLKIKDIPLDKTQKATYDQSIEKLMSKRVSNALKRRQAAKDQQEALKGGKSAKNTQKQQEKPKNNKGMGM